MKKLRNFLDKLTNVRILKRKALYIVLLVVCSLFILFNAMMLLLFSIVSRLDNSEYATATEVEETPEYGDVGEDSEYDKDDDIPDPTDTDIDAAGEADYSYGDLDTDLGGEEDCNDGEDFDVYTTAEGQEPARDNTSRIFVWSMIVFVVLDALWIFMLVYLRRKKERVKEEELQAQKRQVAEGELTHLESGQTQKKRKYSWLVWVIIVAAVVVLILILRITTSNEAAADSQTEATIHSGTVEKSDITTILPGAGTLEEETAEDLSVPEEVEVKRWLVSNGEEVTEGQKVALADEVSVMTAIVAVQDKLDSLDAALADCEDQTATSQVTAPANGRVIKIYAEDGTTVTDTMYQDSALMLLSLDGTMAVDIDTDASIGVGDEVKVTLSDGSVTDGKVDSMANKTATITVTDDGPKLGDTVSVKTTNGQNVGEGKLYIHSEWKVTGFVGTVSSISVSEGSKVSSGSTLLTLTDTEDSGAYDLLLEQRQELEEMMDQLFSIYEDGYICAPCDGVVSGIDKSAAQDQESDITATGTVSKTSTVKVVRLSETENGDDEKDALISELEQRIQDLENTLAGLKDLVGVQNDDDIYAAVQDLKDQIEELQNQLNELKENEGLQSEIDELKKQVEELEKKLSDAENSSQGILYAIGSVDQISENSVTITYFYSSEGNLTKQTVTLPNTVSFYDGKYQKSVSTDKIKEGDVLFLIFDSDHKIQTAICVSKSTFSKETSEESGSKEGLNDFGDEFDEDMDLDGLLGDYDLDEFNLDDYDLDDLDFDLDELDLEEELDEEELMMETAVEDTYGVDTKNLLSVTPEDSMMITITVDEMDILKLTKYQEATVTLDAFPGQSFEGRVTAIHRVGSNSGGNSKYTADIMINREEGMLAGMNASVRITLDTKKNVFCIPEAALVEQDGTVSVYTTCDEASGKLGGLTDVTTGVSNGTDVEILSGLDEGSDYFYSYLDVVNYESTSTLDSDAY